MKISKFGGSSLSDASQIKKVCGIIEMDKDRRVIVVSAPGKGKNDYDKVTDMLILAAREIISSGKEAGLKVLAGIINRYAIIADELGVSSVIKEIKSAFEALAGLDTSNRARFEDEIKAAGEDNCAKLVAAYLVSAGHKAVYVDPGKAGMILSNEPGNAQVLAESYSALRNGLLGEALSADCIVVFPGFFGRTKDGDVITFPRGGSDITGAILAVALKASVYENFTDVDYIYSASPKYVNKPKPIKMITYKEMRELSYSGFEVYHEEAMFPALRADITINVRNVNNPLCQGTFIMPKRDILSNGRVVGIAGASGFSTIFISKYMMNRDIGFGRDVLQVLAEEEISYEHFPSGIDDVTLVIRDSMLGDDLKCERIKDKIENLGTGDEKATVVIKRNELSLIVVVGEGMKYSVGIAAQATRAFCRAGINILTISQGSSEVSMVFGVENDSCKKGIRALYDEYFGDEYPWD